jgi:hypothetical protein
VPLGASSVTISTPRKPVYNVEPVQFVDFANSGNLQPDINRSGATAVSPQGGTRSGEVAPVIANEVGFEFTEDQRRVIDAVVVRKKSIFLTGKGLLLMLCNWLINNNLVKDIRCDCFW